MLTDLSSCSDTFTGRTRLPSSVWLFVELKKAEILQVKLALTMKQAGKQQDPALTSTHRLVYTCLLKLQSEQHLKRAIFPLK